LEKALRENGFRAAIFRHGKSWRLKVSVSKLTCEFVKEEYDRNERGALVWDDAKRGWKTKQVIELRQKTVLDTNLIQSFLITHGFKYSKLIRSGSSDALFEVDHDHNFWKILSE
jgi:hypothetical protein